MHELPITMNIIAIVLEQAKKVQARKVTQVELTIGRLSGIVPECIQFQFDVLKRGSIAVDATLSFIQPLSQLSCRNCGSTYSVEDLQLRCPNCRKQEFDILSGRECYVESIEVE